MPAQTVGAGCAKSVRWVWKDRNRLARRFPPTRLVSRYRQPMGPPPQLACFISLRLRHIARPLRNRVQAPSTSPEFWGEGLRCPGSGPPLKIGQVASVIRTMLSGFGWRPLLSLKRAPVMVKPNGTLLRIGVRLKQRMCDWNPQYLREVLGC